MNRKSPHKRLKAISLFSGAGGLDIGFENAGFEICLAIEKDPSCCDTLRRNRPSLIVIEDSIENVSSEQILNVCGLKPQEIDLVVGGPPCQSFSLAGSRRGLEDPRGKLLLEFVRVVRDILPKVFVLENVKGLLNWNDGNAKDLLLSELQAPIEYANSTYQYDLKYELLNACEYGIPQMRERVFFVGNRLGKSFTFPSKTHADPSIARSVGLKPYTTIWDAIGNLPSADLPSPTALRVAETISGRITRHGY